MRSGLFWGVALGAAAALAGPAAWRSGRPAAKKALRATLEGYVMARRTAARIAEGLEDLVAEVGHDMKEAAAEAIRTGEETIRAGAAVKGPGDE